jgi:hypothetical protein
MSEKGKKELVAIIVNGQLAHVEGDEVSYQKILQLAFGTASEEVGEPIVTYSDGPKENRAGSLKPGGTVEIEKDMNFVVTSTYRS